MAKMNSFLTLIGMKKLKNKLMKKGSSHTSDAKKGNENPVVKLEKVVTLPKKEDLNSTSTDFSVTSEIQGGSTCKVEVREENSNHVEAVEATYEGSDEHDESLSMKRDLSDFDLQAWVPDNGDETDPSTILKNRSYGSITEMNERIERDEESFELIQSGHLSDPGKRTAFWGSPKLKHSCSCLENRDVINKIANQLPPSKPYSFENLRDLVDSVRGEIVQGIQTSPLSVITSCSADKVMLKRQSSSQVLPSRSKKLWWKFFLWSHRNLHRPEIQKHQQLPNQDPFNQKDGYTSDTLEPSRARAVKKSNTKQPKKLESTGSLSIDPWNVSGNNKSQNWDKSHRDDPGSWPQNQWVAFSTESSTLSRVDEWVKSLDTCSVVPHDDHTDGEDTRENSVFTPSPGVGRSPGRTPHSPVRSNLNLTEDVLQADNVIQSLNSFSTVAYIASLGLKVIPSISPFTTLRSVNLSGNFIVHITPGSMPKGLHTLNLSRNKITAIEGLRELTKLRVLDLSYNRISRIGQGLSNCTIIKELYLAGNKISDVEGLHRLLKLTVLDLSFNRVTTAKSLGQLVANYNSLLALNLLGNPIQSNIGDDQLRKTLSNLLPQLAYLNKQPIKPQRAREAVSDSVARAALGNNGQYSRRKVTRRVTQGASSRSRINEGAAHRSRHRLKNNRQR